MKDTILVIIRIILRIILGSIFILGVIYGAVKCSNDQEEKEWNNGYCECGGHYEYQQAVGHQYKTSYIYECDSCGKIIELWEKR